MRDIALIVDDVELNREIPISAQLVSIADVYDALVTDSPYKKPFSTEKAYEMITGGECGTFSPKLLECFEYAREAMERYTAQTTVFSHYK